MSADGNLIAYTAVDRNIQEVGRADDIYLYSALTGTETAVFPRTLCNNGSTIVWQCDSYYQPVLSGDGSTLAFEWEPYGETGGGYSSLALIRAGSQDKTVIATDYANGTSDTYQPVALSGNGDVLLYSVVDETGAAPDELLADGFGASQAPQLGSGGYPTTLWSASLSANGNAVVYTLDQAGSTLPAAYPGVYLWTP
jgi:Tol biopolymer transport system component